MRVTWFLVAERTVRTNIILSRQYFEDEILSGIQKEIGAEALEEAGILVRPESGRVDGKTISINGSQQRFVVLIDSEEE